MATRSRIAVANTDGTYLSVYCHSDGYLGHVGRILVEHYQDALKVAALIALGDLSRLGESVEPDPARPHGFGYGEGPPPQEGVTVAYHRDRGEPREDTPPLVAGNLGALKEQADGDWLYIFDPSATGGPWQVIPRGAVKPRPLAEAVAKELRRNG